jgi:hypothetical protein
MVNPARRPQPARHVGVALSTSGLVAVVGTGRGDPTFQRVPLEPPPTDGAAWPSLARALAELKANGGERLSISLMPPLAEVRAVELPPLRDDEAERVLMRSASRYFVTARQPQIVGIASRDRSSRSATRTVIAAAAPARLVAAIRAAARDAGFTVDAIGPAEGAWAAATAALWPALADRAALVAVAHRDRTDLLRLERGRLVSVRRFRPGAEDAEAIAGAARGPAESASPRVAVIGAHEEAAAMARALVGRGVETFTSPRPGRATDPEILAAEFAATASGPTFRTEDARAAWTAAAWRATALVTAAAIVLVVVGASLKLWGVHRQLDIVRAERAQLAPRLSATLIGRTSVEAVTRNVTGLNAVERATPAWAQTLATLTSAVPDAAYLTAFRTRGDSIVVEGLAEQASDVFNAMEQLPQLANVRAGAPVRRELQDDTTPLERFTIIALQPAFSAPVQPASSASAGPGR